MQFETGAKKRKKGTNPHKKVQKGANSKNVPIADWLRVILCSIDHSGCSNPACVGFAAFGFGGSSLQRCVECQLGCPLATH